VSRDGARGLWFRDDDCLLNNRFEVVGEEVVVAARLGEGVESVVHSRGGCPVRGMISDASSSAGTRLGMSMGFDRPEAMVRGGDWWAAKLRRLSDVGERKFRHPTSVYL
jgi:hypothetical protein